MWHVYILLCEDNSLYTGISPDPQKRFEEHKAGRGARYTRSHKPLKILYVEGFKSKAQALKREAEIKGWSRKEKINTLRLLL